MTAITVDSGTRRDFLYVSSGALGAVGVAASTWPFVDQMNPTTATLALSSIEVDLSAVQHGQQIVYKWRGQPLFVRRRTPAEIPATAAVDVKSLPDPLARNANLPDDAPASDSSRAVKSEWLVLIGICTHLGCVPAVSTGEAPEGEFGGWMCHCHGSQYDTAGRIRKGPAPRNLPIPLYSFVSDTRIKVG
jgi:ubiquinol-cytochrome c reductase iron-sulfur subunit